MPNNREKFATQMDKELLAELRALAKAQGRQIQSVVEEAVEQYVHEHDPTKPNPKVMAAAQECMERYSKTLEYLAK